MTRENGYLLHGVDHVLIEGHLPSDPPQKKITCDGRVFLWDNGAITVYRENAAWRIFPAHRVIAIVGKEQG